MSEEQPDRKLKLQIEQNLKRVYEDVVKEDVPDRFKLLLAQLRDRESGKGSTK